jgi:phosphoribosylformylglycinamidine synthase I
MLRSFFVGSPWPPLRGITMIGRGGLRRATRLNPSFRTPKRGPSKWNCASTPYQADKPRVHGGIEAASRSAVLIEFYYPMRFGVVVFPGSNCDHDAWYAVSKNLGQHADFIWHDSTNLNNLDAVILPGGFAYGDYLRCGAIAKFSPVMASVRKFARDGGLVMGICNGFQILTESGLLPGALVRNVAQKFICRPLPIRVETTDSPFTGAATRGQVLHLPIAHGEGCYVADQRTLDQIESEDRVLFRYLDNPNGSMRGIAGILNEGRNVMGMMPHPERATEPLMGSSDGLVVLQSVVAAWVAQASACV